MRRISQITILGMILCAGILSTCADTYDFATWMSEAKETYTVGEALTLTIPVGTGEKYYKLSGLTLGNEYTFTVSGSNAEAEVLYTYTLKDYYGGTYDTYKESFLLGRYVQGATAGVERLLIDEQSWEEDIVEDPSTEEPVKPTGYYLHVYGDEGAVVNISSTCGKRVNGEVKFDAGKGVCEEDARVVRIGSAVGELPVAECDSCDFFGWFTSMVGGEQVTAETIVENDVTFYAHWWVSDGGPYKEVVDGIEWTFRVENGEASVGGGDWNSTAVSSSTAGAITIPATLGGCPVASVGWGAFWCCSSIESVNIPSCVTRFEAYSFYCCNGLTNVIISQNVSYIDSSAFSSCRGLVSIVVDQENEHYKSENNLLLTKDGCKVVAGIGGDVEIPSGVTDIGWDAFSGRSKLTSVSIPSSVTNIGNYAFCNDSSLCDVVFPGELQSIGAGAFSCAGLTNVFIPASVSYIGECAFAPMNGDGLLVTVSSDNPSYCSSEGALYSKDMSILYAWPRNKKIELPQSVKDIRRSACSPNEKSVGETLVLPSNVMNVGQGAFSNNRFASIQLNEGIVAIGESAFGWSDNLSSLTIPSSVTILGRRSFVCCYNLDSVDFEGAPPEGLVDAGFEQDIVIRYNVAYEDEWLPVIAECGWTHAVPYIPSPSGTVLFVVPNGVASEQSHVYTNETYGVLPEARREGCTFAGWYTSIDGTNRVSAFSTVDANVKTLYARWVEDETALYAQWQANAYSVNFNANGGEGEMGAQSFLYDQAQTLNGNAFTKLGYMFKGWSTVPDGDVVYSNKVSVSNLTAEAGFAVALFAKWEKVIDVATDAIEDWVVYDLAPLFKKQGESGSAYRKRFEAKFGDDYAAAFFKETGKIGMDGARLQVWHDYVAGTDPLDETSQFKATVTMEGGVPVITWNPALNGDGVKDGIRRYKVLGAKTLGGGWSEVNGDEADYRFFKVTVEMP